MWAVESLFETSEFLVTNKLNELLLNTFTFFSS